MNCIKKFIQEINNKIKSPIELFRKEIIKNLSCDCLVKIELPKHVDEEYKIEYFIHHNLDKKIRDKFLNNVFYSKKYTQFVCDASYLINNIPSNIILDNLNLKRKIAKHICEVKISEIKNNNNSYILKIPEIKDALKNLGIDEMIFKLCILYSKKKK